MDLILKDLEQNWFEYGCSKQLPKMIDKMLVHITWSSVDQDTLMHAITTHGARVEHDIEVNTTIDCNFCCKVVRHQPEWIVKDSTSSPDKSPCKILKVGAAKYYYICANCCKIVDSVTRRGNCYIITERDNISIYYRGYEYNYVLINPMKYEQMKTKCLFCPHNGHNSYACADYLAPVKREYISALCRNYTIFRGADLVSDVILYIGRFTVKWI